MKRYGIPIRIRRQSWSRSAWTEGPSSGVDKDLRASFLLPLIDKKAAAGFVNASVAIDRTRGVKDAEEQEAHAGRLPGSTTRPWRNSRR